MSQMGQERRIGAVQHFRFTHTSGRKADIVEPPVSATSGREQAQHA
jgi:hypothetical protein